MNPTYLLAIEILTSAFGMLSIRGKTILSKPVAQTARVHDEAPL